MGGGGLFSAPGVTGLAENIGSAHVGGFRGHGFAKMQMAAARDAQETGTFWYFIRESLAGFAK